MRQLLGIGRLNSTLGYILITIVARQIVGLMDDNVGGSKSKSKVTGIRQIVKLKEILQKWQSVTLGGGQKGVVNINLEESEGGGGGGGSHDDDGGGGGGGISPAISRRLMIMSSNHVYCDSDEDGCHSPELPPHGVPKGYLAVYVGLELRRFIIPTTYLTHPVFKVLLEKVEEEFGFDHSGGLTIPCEIETFKYLLKCIDKHHHPSSQRHY